MDQNTKAYIQLHLSVFLVGFTAILGKLISLAEVPLVWWRLLFTSISLLFFPQIWRRLKLLDRKTFWSLAGIGVLVAIHWVTFYGSIKYANASIALICFSTITIFTAFLEPIFFRKKINGLEVLLGGVVTFGIYLIFSVSGEYITGIVLGIIAAFLAAVFSILNKKVVHQAGPNMITFIELFAGLIFLSLLMPVYLPFSAEASFLPVGEDWLYLLILSLVCTTLAYNLALKALKHLSAYISNLALNLEPIYGIIMAYFILKEGEELPLEFYVGTSLILLAVFGHVLSGRMMKRKRPQML